MPRCERRDSGDPALPLVQVTAGRLRAVFLPSVGGRLLSLRVDGRELLWVNPAVFDADLAVVAPRATWPPVTGSFGSWTNVGGSKTWPAPQGWSGPAEWPGPPDPVIDSGDWSYRVEPDDGDESGSLRLTMDSPPDLRTGLRVRRAYAFDDGSLDIHQTITLTNVGDRDVRWSAWEVCQVATASGGEVAVPVERDDPPLDLGAYAGAVVPEREPGRVRLPVVPGVAKLGFPHASGPVSWRAADGAELELSAAVEPGADYPDGGSRVELWTQSPQPAPLPGLDGLHPDAWLVELEVLSPLRHLAPGGRATFGIRWRLRPPDPPVTPSSGSGTPSG